LSFKYSYDRKIKVSTDPSFKKYPLLSIYIFCSDNSIRFTDIDGKDKAVGIKMFFETVKKYFYLM